MTFGDRVLLWLHIAFVMFAIGPATAAIMSTPRYIRARNLVVTAYLYRITRVFSAASLGVLLFGIILASTEHKISRPWVTASMTLFVVAAVLLVLIMRDQHKAVDALKIAGQTGEGGTAVAIPAAETTADGEQVPAVTGPGDTTAEPVTSAADAMAQAAPAAEQKARAAHLAAVERGRIASMGGVVSIIWLVILVLMVWNS